MDYEIYCGDYAETLPHVQANLIFTSPPYNIGSKQARCDGFRRKGLYDKKSYGGIHAYPDTLPEDTYQSQQIGFFRWCAAHLHTNGILVYNHKPRRREGRMIHPAEWFLDASVREELLLMEEIVWDRGSTHNHCSKLMWPQTERLYVFRLRNGTYRLQNNAALQCRSDLWKIERSPKNGHNAPFPLALAETVIHAWSMPGDVVCDPYMGSGTTGIAAVRLGRIFVGSEMLDSYYQLACSRLQTSTKEAA